jgi:hypothetical protein
MSSLYSRRIMCGSHVAGTHSMTTSRSHLRRDSVIAEICIQAAMCCSPTDASVATLQAWSNRPQNLREPLQAPLLSFHTRHAPRRHNREMPATCGSFQCSSCFSSCRTEACPTLACTGTFRDSSRRSPRATPGVNFPIFRPIASPSVYASACQVLDAGTSRPVVDSCRRP